MFSLSLFVCLSIDWLARTGLLSFVWMKPRVIALRSTESHPPHCSSLKILRRMMKLCVLEMNDGTLFARENEQRLLRNMDVHVVVLDLLKIPYDKVSSTSTSHLHDR